MKRHIISINEELCNGCGQCIMDCAEGALAIENNKAKIIADNLCDGLGACLPRCPTNALQIIVREADSFDLEIMEKHAPKAKNIFPNSCPGTTSKSFDLKPLTDKPLGLRLGTWPLKLRVVSAQADFFREAHLLLAADCSGAAAASFHTLTQDKVVLLMCPKLEDISELYTQFSEILANNNIKSVTFVRMEVPCCLGVVTLGETLCQDHNIPYDIKIMRCNGFMLE